MVVRCVMMMVLMEISTGAGRTCVEGVSREVHLNVRRHPRDVTHHVLDITENPGQVWKGSSTHGLLMLLLMMMLVELALTPIGSLGGMVCGKSVPPKVELEVLLPVHSLAVSGVLLLTVRRLLLLMMSLLSASWHLLLLMLS